MNDLRELYEEVILDHNRSPRNYGRRPDECNRTAHGHNPLCGDQVEVSMTIRGGVIEDIAFDGEGCAISTASASMMTPGAQGADRRGGAVAVQCDARGARERRSAGPRIGSASWGRSSG